MGRVIDASSVTHNGDSSSHRLRTTLAHASSQTFASVSEDQLQRAVVKELANQVKAMFKTSMVFYMLDRHIVSMDGSSLVVFVDTVGDNGGTGRRIVVKQHNGLAGRLRAPKSELDELGIEDHADAEKERRAQLRKDRAGQLKSARQIGELAKISRVTLERVRTMSREDLIAFVTTTLERN